MAYFLSESFANQFKTTKKNSQLRLGQASDSFVPCAIHLWTVELHDTASTCDQRLIGFVERCSACRLQQLSSGRMRLETWHFILGGRRSVKCGSWIEHL